jgi:phage terminase small subunit
MDLTPPKRIRGIALKTWKRLAPQLLEDRTLTELSVDHFVAYCDAVALYEHTAAIVDRLVAAGKSLVAETPNGGKQQIPEIGIANRALATVRWLGEVFAIDPYTRERRGLHVPASPSEEEKDADSLLSRPTG